MQVGVDPSTGTPIQVACGTCHATRTPDLANGMKKRPLDFHQGLSFQHGELACLACHHADNYDELHLADGSSLDFVDSMQLCAQCHAKRHEDYLHGAHGGMSGFWDASRGPSSRKHCIDCHDPHWPAFPKMQPTFKPIDRFLSSPSEDQPDHD